MSMLTLELGGTWPPQGDHHSIQPALDFDVLLANYAKTFQRNHEVAIKISCEGFYIVTLSGHPAFVTLDAKAALSKAYAYIRSSF